MSNGSEIDASCSDSRPARASSIREWLDVTAKLIGAVAIAGVTLIGYNYQSKASLSSVINQREQAESQLRASMLGDLVEPIIGKNGAASDDADLERQLLLAEMVTLNFHDHFEFKPLLLEVDAKLLAAGEKGNAGHAKIASDARRVVDRQINMLTSMDGNSRKGGAYNAKVTGIDLMIPSDLRNPATPDKNCRKEGDIRTAKPAAEPTVVCVPSPDHKICLVIGFFAPDYATKQISMKTKVLYPPSPSFSLWGRQTTTDCKSGEDYTQDKVEELDEAHVSIFDFPLTDNSKLVWKGVEYRYSVSLYEITDADRPIRLKLVWFPEGYVTERERPPPRLLR